MIIFAFFYDRSQIHVGTIVYQIVYSLCVDLFADVHVYSTHVWINAVFPLEGVGVIIKKKHMGVMHENKIRSQIYHI